jgi:hypothetical protein
MVPSSFFKRIIPEMITDMRGIEMHRILPLALLGVCAWWGFHKLGPTGIFWGWLGWGFSCFVYYALKDMAVGFKNFIDPNKPKKVDLTVTQGEPWWLKNYEGGHPDIEGKVTRSNPDPTRPTDEDFAGLLTVRISKGGWH